LRATSSIVAIDHLSQGKVSYVEALAQALSFSQWGVRQADAPSIGVNLKAADAASSNARGGRIDFTGSYGNSKQLRLNNPQQRALIAQ
jgi:hypothetical protein